MKQDKIWDHFQNDGHQDTNFPEARQRFMLDYLKQGSTVLNIGVGSGALERLGLEKGIEMYALDPGEKAIERLRKNFGMGERAQAGYAQAMPFGDGSFDTVVMSEVLEHLDDEVLAASLTEVWRVLKPGGFLLASTPFHEDLAAKQVVCPACGTVFHKVGHVQSFDKLRMRNLLETHGFKVNRLWVTTFVDWQRKGIKNHIKSMLRIFLARLGEGIADPHVLVIAHKGGEGLR